MTSDTRYDIVTPFSGKHYALGPYVRALDGLQWPRSRMNLIWITNSRDRSFIDRLQDTADGAQDAGFSVSLYHARHIPVPDGPDGGAAHASLYQIAETMAERDLLCWEDDILPNPDALIRLDRVARENPRAGTISADVKQRRNGMAGYWWRDGRLRRAGGPLLSVDWHHFCLAIVRRQALESVPHPRFRPNPSPEWEEPGLIGADTVLCQMMRRRGWDCVVDTSHRADHLDEDGTIY